MTRAFLLLTLAAITWAAHFWHFTSFGLYVDDYAILALPIGMSCSEFFNLLVQGASFNGPFSLDGRPLGFILLELFSFFGYRLGGLKALYLFSYIINLTNVFLVYLLLRRLYDEKIFAFTGALAFALFPADTTYAWLSIIVYRISITFLLVALLAYLHDRRKLSYFIILCSLLTCEMPYIVFIAAPLLKEKWDMKLRRRLIKHLFILGIGFACVAMLRYLAGEGRATFAVHNLSFIFHRSMKSMLQGPIMSMKMYLYRSAETLSGLNREGAVFCTISFAWLMLAFSNVLKLDISHDAARPAAVIKNKVFYLEMPESLRQLNKMMLIGLVMLILAYPISFTDPPVYVDSVMSHVHMTAALGASLLSASFFTIFLFVANIYRLRHIAVILLSVFFASLVGFGLTVQQDYRQSWQYQRAFWTDAIKLCPDITDETVILADISGRLKAPKQMTAVDAWHVDYGLVHIYKSPYKEMLKHYRGSELRPALYILKWGWRKGILLENGVFKLDESTVLSWPGFHREMESVNVIFLEIRNGILTRRSEPLIIDGREIPIKKLSASRLTAYEKGPLYNDLIMPANEMPVEYFNRVLYRNARSREDYGADT